MCIICELMNMGVSDVELALANFMTGELNYATYVIVFMNYRANMTQTEMDYYRLRMVRLARADTEETERAMHIMGFSPEDILDFSSYNQNDYKAVLAEVLTSLLTSFNMYSQYLTPLSQIELAVEIAQRRANGEVIQFH